MDLEIPDKVSEKADLRILAALVIVVQFGFILHLALPLSGGSSEKEQELTQYQMDYVDCPREYLEVCTELSKVPTEEVTFQKVEDGKIYLQMESNRTLIAELKGEESAEIISMQ